MPVKRFASKGICCRWRPKKGLCVRCGLDTHEGTCEENYEKVDMRSTTKKHKPNSVDNNKKIKTIQSYRKKKGLCLKCGLLEGTQPCIENYTKSDNRKEEEKKDDPRTVKTPKEQIKTVIEVTQSKKKFKFISKNINYDKSPFNRKYILLDLFESKDGYRIDFSAINHLSKTYSTYLICIVGDLNKYFKYDDILKINKDINIYVVKDQIVKYLNHCNMFLSYHNDYKDFCNDYDIKFIQFDSAKEVNSLMLSSTMKEVKFK